MVAFVRPSALTLFLCLSAPAALAAQDAASGSPAPGVEASGRGRMVAAVRLPANMVRGSRDSRASRA